MVMVNGQNGISGEDLIWRIEKIAIFGRDLFWQTEKNAKFGRHFFWQITQWEKFLMSCNLILTWKWKNINTGFDILKVNQSILHHQ